MDTWYVSHLPDLSTTDSPQRQILTPTITSGSQISAGFVVMPPGHRAAPHLHRKYDIVVMVLEGNVMSVLGDNLEETIEHGPGDSILVEAGVPHLGVNLSRTHRVVLIECRADPTFVEDVQLLPHLEERADELMKLHQDRFVESASPHNVLEML